MDVEIKSKYTIIPPTNMNEAIETCTDLNIYTIPAKVDKLINELLESEDYSKKHNARIALIGMGKPVVPHMHKLLKSENGLLRKEVAKIVQLIADKNSIQSFIILLDDNDFDIRWIAAEGLIKIGRLSIVPLLKSIRDGKSSMYLDKRAHQVLNSLLNEKEKKDLISLMQCLDDFHELQETSPVEAMKAIKYFKK